MTLQEQIAKAEAAVAAAVQREAIARSEAFVQLSGGPANAPAAERWRKAEIHLRESMEQLKVLLEHQVREERG